eukprot:IDg20192t1
MPQLKPATPSAVNRTSSKKRGAMPALSWSTFAPQLQLQLLREDLRTLPDVLPPLTVSDADKYLTEVDPRAKPSDNQRAAKVPLGETLRVSVVGSFLLGLWAPERGVDVAVRAPSSYFGDRDVPNYRYHSKRAAFLARIARHLDTSCKRRWTVALRGEHCGIPYSPRSRCVCRVTRHPQCCARAGRGGRGRAAAADSAPNFAAATRLVSAWCARRRLMPGYFLPAVLVASTITGRRAPRTATAA